MVLPSKEESLLDEQSYYIFGAGIYGKTAFCEMQARGGEILGFLDNSAAKQGRVVFRGVRCLAPAEVPQASRGVPVVVANKKAKVRAAIRAELSELGFTEVRAYGVDDVYAYCKTLDDEACLRMQWEIHIGGALDLAHPVTFNEKLQWLKLHDRNPLYPMLVDKVAVKPWVAERIGAEHVIPTLGVWERFDDIDFDSLPDKFVLKCTHDSGSIVFCTDKTTFDRAAAREKLTYCLEHSLYWLFREWSYKDVKPRIIAEPYLVDESGAELKDYKVQVFAGEPKFIQVDFDRFAKHQRNLYDTDWTYIEATIDYPTDPHRHIPRPKELPQLLSFARKLSEGMPYVRTDFYIVNDKILFGEMTYYHGAGYETFTPSAFGVAAGDWIPLPRI